MEKLLDEYLSINLRKVDWLCAWDRFEYYESQ